MLPYSLPTAITITPRAPPKLHSNKSEKKDKYLDLARELKKLCNMKVTIISSLI